MSEMEPVRTLAGGRLLARNAMVNFAGLAAPMVVALIAIPFLVRDLGADRFGFIGMAWVVIGYFSIFDLGLGRALTKLVAERLGNGGEEEIPTLTWTALLMMLGLGVVGAVAVSLLSPWLISSVLKVPATLQAESLTALYLLAFSLPWVIVTAGLRGLLEANQSFGWVNALRVPMGVFSYLGPLVVLPFSNGLVPIIATLVAGRIAACLAHLVICLRVFPALRATPRAGRRHVRELLTFGGWMTVSNLVSPLMTHADRFIIGGLISLAAVAYYVTPFELITRIGVFPAALLGVLFPAFATTYASDRARTLHLFRQSVRAMLVILFPICLVAVSLAREGLTVWLGPEFARESAAVLQWLAVGMFINGLAQVPYSVLQGIGRPDITGKLHLAELPFYILAIWFLGLRFGVEGVAMAWVLRVAVDSALLFVAAGRFLPGSSAELRQLAGVTVAGLAILGIAAFETALAIKLVGLAAVLASFGAVAWFWILSPAARTLARG